MRGPRGWKYNGRSMLMDEFFDIEVQTVYEWLEDFGLLGLVDLKIRLVSYWHDGKVLK